MTLAESTDIATVPLDGGFDVDSGVPMIIYIDITNNIKKKKEIVRRM
jgi:hypothetical protein